MLEKRKKQDVGGMKSDARIHVSGLLKHYIHRQHVSIARKLTEKSTPSYFPHRLRKRLCEDSFSQMG